MEKTSINIPLCCICNKVAWKNDLAFKDPDLVYDGSNGYVCTQCAPFVKCAELSLKEAGISKPSKGGNQSTDSK